MLRPDYRYSADMRTPRTKSANHLSPWKCPLPQPSLHAAILLCSVPHLAHLAHVGTSVWSIRLGIFVSRNRLAWSVRHCTSVSLADQTAENVSDMLGDVNIIECETWTYEGKSWGYGRLASSPSSCGSAGR